MTKRDWSVVSWTMPMTTPTHSRPSTTPWTDTERVSQLGIPAPLQRGESSHQGSNAIHFFLKFVIKVPALHRRLSGASFGTDLGKQSTDQQPRRPSSRCHLRWPMSFDLLNGCDMQLKTCHT